MVLEELGESGDEDREEEDMLSEDGENHDSMQNNRFSGFYFSPLFAFLGRRE